MDENREFKRSTGKISARQGASLIRRTMTYCLPAGLLLIGLTCYFGFTTTQEYVKEGIERNVKMRGVVISRTLEDFVEHCVQDLLYLNQGHVDQSVLLEFMTRKSRISPGLFREAAFISSSPATSALVVEALREIQVIAPEGFGDVKPNPMFLPDSLPPLEDGQVHITPIEVTEFPFSSPNKIGNVERFSALRIVTPHRAPDGGTGYLMLALDANTLRRELTRITSSDNNAWGFERSSEVRFSYLVNPEGWILMQSVAGEEEKELSTFLARAGFFGTLGKQGLPSAFLPDKRHADFWEVMQQLRAGSGGFLIQQDGGHHRSPEVSSYFLAYEPVFYNPRTGGNREFLFGLFFVDRSKLAVMAKRAILFNAFVWGSGALLLLTLFVVATYRISVRPLIRLRDSVAHRVESGSRLKIPTVAAFAELSGIADSANRLLKKLELAEKRLETMNEDPMSEDMRQPAPLEAGYERAVLANRDFPEFIGISSALTGLKEQIAKTAQTSVDVFIMGETGTGKQLIAEAIHRLSKRKDGPFVAINCGALNENLLLDTLFGHVKGAHSEAKGNRKGAFLEADGGTLFLDEIQSASLTVQQSLLRAIAERKVRPLGSDQEIPMDVRLITATNRDLPGLIKEGMFREDLFYRLYVLTLQTLPLRMHKEDIPLLAYHYLKQTQEILGKTDMQLSKGALKILLDHNWPGNVRELVNTITRSVVFAKGAVIEASDLRMEDTARYAENELAAAREKAVGEAPQSSEAASPQRGAPRQSEQQPSEPAVGEAFELSARQRNALGWILDRKSISRKEYQQIIGNDLPARTANYDLNDFMQKGILLREGQGASTRYRLSAGVDFQALRRMATHGDAGDISPQEMRGYPGEIK
jgi:DNA-binding NtrC family response regulator